MVFAGGLQALFELCGIRFQDICTGYLSATCGANWCEKSRPKAFSSSALKLEIPYKRVVCPGERLVSFSISGGTPIDQL